MITTRIFVQGRSTYFYKEYLYLYTHTHKHTKMAKMSEKKIFLYEKNLVAHWHSQFDTNFNRFVHKNNNINKETNLHKMQHKLLYLRKYTG